MSIGDRIRRERTARDMSVRKLGAIIGVSGSAVSQWENGGNILWENRVALSKALDIPISDFLPEGTAPKEMTIQDPQEMLLIQRFRLLAPKLREAYLGMLIVQGEQPPGTAPPD